MKVDLGRISAYLICLYILFPILIVASTSFTSTPYVTFPPKGFSLEWFVRVLRDTKILNSMLVSFVLASITSVVSSILGLLGAIAIVRYRFRGRDLLNSLFLAPVLAPMIVLGVGLLFFFTDIGLIGTLPGLVLGHTVIAFPYVLRTVSVSLSGVDRTLEKSAMSLGASEFRTFLQITLPLIRSGILAGFLFCFMTSFNNVSISLFLAGPKLPTLPLTIFYNTQLYFDPTTSAVSTIILIITLVIMLGLERTLGLYRLLEKAKAISQ